MPIKPNIKLGYTILTVAHVQDAGGPSPPLLPPPSSLHGCWETCYFFAYCGLVGNPHLTARISILLPFQRQPSLLPPPSLPPSLPPLPRSLPPSLPLSLSPSLPPSLSPSLPLSLSPSLPLSLSPSSLPPSLPSPPSPPLPSRPLPSPPLPSPPLPSPII